MALISLVYIIFQQVPFRDIEFISKKWEKLKKGIELISILSYNILAITMESTEPGQVGNEAAIRELFHVW